jgi:aryl-alcohol dehydrogenase-like predicted oxidoreductase
MTKKKNDFSRREFLTTTAKGAALVSATGLYHSCKSGTNKEKEQTSQEAGDQVRGEIPRRTLGKTGLEVSILSFGGGSQFLKNPNGEWEKHLEAAVSSGVNLFDTSCDYTVVSRDGSKALASEERFGEILPAYRDKVIVTTKFNEREAEPARKSVEESLKRMKMDYIDIVMIHSIDEKDSISQLEKGIYGEMVKMKNEGIARFIGFSSMDSAERSKDVIEALDFDAVILALNPSRYGDYPGVAIPAAIKRNVGIIAMKVTRDLVGKDATAEELLEYSWGHEGIASSVVGHVGMEVLRENIGLAVAYGKKLANTIDRKELETRLASYAGPHALCWARPGYRDGGIIV